MVSIGDTQAFGQQRLAIFVRGKHRQIRLYQNSGDTGVIYNAPQSNIIHNSTLLEIRMMIPHSIATSHQAIIVLC